MNAIGSLMILIGVIALYAAKTAMGNRDNRYIDAQIEHMKTQKAKRQDAKRSLSGHSIISLGDCC
ncbi:hypothetical protein [Polycladomyces subterraneus]|uniref:Uncharacterized protein n=1 Tax=Polycladomyces subterraneus TaxID=1016997 RepID=A0ABT8IPL8_9BACL|nr:hypothetical protein [Polycladomyces subterraneus]MDN4594735.1 hypothetical protein [Polycladomyces subterraneus]